MLLSIFLKGQYLWLGRAIYAWQIAALFGLMFLGTGRSNDISAPDDNALTGYRLSFVVYFTYTCFLSITLWLVYAAEGLDDDGTEVSILRVITRVVYFGFLVGLFGIGLWAGRFLSAVNLLYAVVVIATVIAYGAILQFLRMRFVGLNIFRSSDQMVPSGHPT